jgi:putative acetyltransferase
MRIRPENTGDFDMVRKVNIKAFGQESEADLVDALRKSGIPLISLVTEEDNKITGHIIFSPVTIDGCASISIAGLAPMAVLPEFQRKGIGSMLVKEGLKQCKQAGYSAVVVLGHPEYYPRFGFVPSSTYNIKSEYDVPENVFMILELPEGALKGCHGTAKYHENFM